MTHGSLKSDFLLDPGIVFLNHGSYGACPRPVFDAYQAWQRTLERNPVALLSHVKPHLDESRAHLARYLNVAADDVVYFQNPTSAFNAVARSMVSAGGPLCLRPGDEVLSSDHEYGAMERTWRYVCRETGAAYVRRPVPLPVASPEASVDAFWAGVSERTRVIFLSHITSPTALIFPVAEICRRARAAGLLTIIDGAHAPGQIDLDMAALDADFYVAACHKWMCAAKGSAFLYARRELQRWLEPLIVSFGWNDEAQGEGKFIDFFQIQGTRDPAAYLSVPAAIEFMAEHDWPAVRRRCHALAIETRARLDALTGLEPICPASEQWLGQFFAARLPDLDTALLAQRLGEEYGIVVPVLRWNDQPLIRVSFQAYNDRADADALLVALEKLLPEMSTKETKATSL
jgi:isopenicillin-N epimerase